MNNRPKDPKTARNKNVLVVGGSGSGKTRFFVKPQIMQMHSSYCMEIYRNTAAYAKENGEIQKWRDSKAENIACRDAVDGARFVGDRKSRAQGNDLRQMARR